jgi:hypothetical protein
MITVTVQTIQDEKLDLVVADRKNLINCLIILEKSSYCKAFKVSLSEGVLVTNLYKDFGYGEFSKFVTEFNWGE